MNPKYYADNISFCLVLVESTSSTLIKHIIKITRLLPYVQNFYTI